MAPAADIPPLVVVRKIHATPRAIWRGLTQPELLKNWLAAGERKILAVEADVRVGGRYRIVMRCGSASKEVAGEYVEVVPHEKLVYTCTSNKGAADASLVAFELTIAADATEILLRHDGFRSADARERGELWWSRCIRRLARVVG
jgi:uncharacterized protein YndB with AHSA1/START domain